MGWVLPGNWAGSLGLLPPVPDLGLPAPWVLHPMASPWILPFRYLEYAWVAKTRFRPSTLFLALSPPPSILFPPSLSLTFSLSLYIDLCKFCFANNDN